MPSVGAGVAVPGVEKIIEPADMSAKKGESMAD